MAYSEASKRATIKYQREHLKRIPLSVPLEFYESLKAAADITGESVNGYIKAAILQRMERDGSAVGVQASPAAGHTPPVGELATPGAGRVTPLSNRKSEKPLTD